ncbi:hypothetical protein ACPA9J_15045 [Pseudomonas aeruginosa]
MEHIRDLVSLQLPGIGLLPMPVARGRSPTTPAPPISNWTAAALRWKQLAHSRRLRLPHRRPVPGLNYLAFWAIRG